MASFPTTLPSTSQMLQLASLLPPSKPPPPSPSHALRDFVDGCRATWIRDFLFAADPLHIQYFTSDAFSSTAFLTHFTVTVAEAPRPNPTSLLYGENCHTEGTLLFVPAFTAGHITVGFGVNDCLRTIGAPWLAEGRISHPLRYNFRFVTDMSSGLFLITYDTPSRDCVFVNCLRLEQTTRVHRFEGVAHRKQLLECIHDDDGGLNTEKLLRSLQFFHHNVQYRPCYVCGSPANSFCDCALPIANPAHPFDSQYFTSGMQQFFGHFEDVMNKVICADEQNDHAVLALRTSIYGISAPPLAQKLKAWTLAEHAQSLAEHPWKSPSFIASDRALPGNLCWIEGPASDHDCYAVEHHDAPLATVATRSGQSLMDGTMPRSSAGIMSGCLHDTLLEAPLLSKEVWDTHDLGGPRSSQSVLGMGSIQEKNEVTDDMHLPIPTTFIADRPTSSELQTLGNNIAIEELGRTEATGSGAIALGSVQSNRNENVRSELSITGQLKNEIRKERNRASARRCHMRNKVMREELISELNKCHEEVDRLRVKEGKLRSENIWLRRLSQEIHKVVVRDGRGCLKQESRKR